MAPHPVIGSSFEDVFDDIKENVGLDLDTKLTALEVSPHVVSLVSYTGTERLFVCSGTIIECEESNGTFFSTILTSASLLRCPSGEAVVAPDIKVNVYLSDGKSDTLLEVQVSLFDFLYNIATIKIRSKAALPTATLRHLDDFLSFNPSALHGPGDMVVDSSSSHSNLCKITPGDRVIALGRHYKSYDLMAASGEFSVDSCDDFDCEELFMARCKITKSGIGGPLINRYGEVIGINFYHERYTPFLPINIAFTCLEDLKKHGRVRRPWLGMEVTNLYAISVNKLENIVQKSPSICKGVIVEKVIPKSPAECAGICIDDVIVQCGGIDVRCCLEFFKIMWDKAGKPVKVVVMRRSVDDAYQTLTMVADETSPDKYEWPVPEEIDEWATLVRDAES